jgi:cytoskeletal protein CcmA (bactofilin family)
VNVNAVISGQAGVALLVDGAKLASIHAGRSGGVVRRSLPEARFLMGDAEDLQFLEDIEIDEVIRRLELASAQMDAFHTALILLDGSLPSETRQIAAEELEEFLEDDALAHFVENVLFAQPLTRDSDLPGALTVCSEHTGKTWWFLHHLASLQEVITEVCVAWEGIPSSVFGAEANRKTTRSLAVKEGLFRDLVLRRAAHASIDSFPVDALLKSKMPHLQEILHAWCVPLRDYPHYESEIQFVAEGPGRPSAEVQRQDERTTIGRAIFVNGNLTGDEDLLIEGCVEGRIDLPKNNVTVGKSGRVTADIYGRVVTVEGEVEGNIFAREAILRQSGAIHGNISALRVVLEDGSRFKGSIDMKAEGSEWAQAAGTRGPAQERASAAAVTRQRVEREPSRIED